MDEIRDATGLSKATLYNYFPSKLELFVQVMQREVAAGATREFESLAKGLHDLPSALRQFGRSMLTALYSPEMLAMRRMVAFEAGRSNLGQLCYERGPKRGDAMMTELLKQAMDERRLRKADPGVAAHHLRALIEAEFQHLLLFGLTIPVTSKRIGTAVDRAVEVFLTAYAPSAKT